MLLVDFLRVHPKYYDYYDYLCKLYQYIYPDAGIKFWIKDLGGTEASDYEYDRDELTGAKIVRRTAYISLMCECTVHRPDQQVHVWNQIENFKVLEGLFTVHHFNKGDNSGWKLEDFQQK